MPISFTYPSAFFSPSEHIATKEKIYIVGTDCDIYQGAVIEGWDGVSLLQSHRPYLEQIVCSLLSVLLR